mgnify:CR=1 FL=1
MLPVAVTLVVMVLLDRILGLRQRAMSSLGAGRTPDGERFNASEALEVLYRLASSPATAPDAPKI